MREDHHQIRKVNADVIGKHRLRIHIARARKNRSAGVNHYRQAQSLRPLVHRPQRTEAVAIFVGRKKLMRRMNLQSANAQLLQPVHLSSGIGNIFRMHGAKCQQPLGIGATVFRNPIVHFRW